MRRAILATAALSLTATFAQSPANPKAPTNEDLLITQSQLQDILRNAPVAKDTGKPGEVSSKLFDASTYSASFIRLNEPDKPHVHAQASEVYIMQQGSATLETGGTMIGPFTSGGVHHQGANSAAPRPTPSMPSAPLVAGDKGGTAIEGGRIQKVKAGDIVLIPAGVAHTWTEVEQPVVYLDIKFPKAE